MDYSPQGCKESDTTDQLSIHIKAARGKQQVIYKGTPIRLIADFGRNSAGQKGVAQYILSDEREKSTTKNNLHSKVLFQICWRDQKLYRQAKLKEFRTIKPVLQEMLKRLF